MKSLRIRGLRVRAVVVPMKRPLATSIALVSSAPLLLLDLQTSAGIVGRHTGRPTEPLPRGRYSLVDVVTASARRLRVVPAQHRTTARALPYGRRRFGCRH